MTWQNALSEVVKTTMETMEKGENVSFRDTLKKVMTSYKQRALESKGQMPELEKIPTEDFMNEFESLAIGYLENRLNDAITGAARTEQAVKVFLQDGHLILDNERVRKTQSMVYAVFGTMRGGVANERLADNISRSLMNERVKVSNPKLKVLGDDTLYVARNQTDLKIYDKWIIGRELLTPEEELKASKSIMKVKLSGGVPKDNTIGQYVEALISEIIRMLENNILVISRQQNRSRKAVKELLSDSKRQMDPKAFAETMQMACDLLGTERGKKAFKHAYQLVARFIAFEGISLDNQCKFQAFVNDTQDTYYGKYFSGTDCELITPKKDILSAHDFMNIPDATEVPEGTTIKDYVSTLGAETISMMEINIFLAAQQENNSADAWTDFLTENTRVMDPTMFTRIRNVSKGTFGENTGAKAFKIAFDLIARVIREKDRIALTFDEKKGESGEYRATRIQFTSANFERWSSGIKDAQLPDYSKDNEEPAEEPKPDEGQNQETSEPATAEEVKDAFSGDIDDDDDYFQDLMEVLEHRNDADGEVQSEGQSQS